MLTLPASVLRLRPDRITAAAAAWACFWVGALACYALVLLRLADLGPAAGLLLGFAAFHAGLAASCWAIARGLQRGSGAALFANAVPVGLFWLAAGSLAQVLGRFPLSP
ncbi:MAG TPA: hypothetical protein VM327_09955 [Candidatus Thermoplasmatota archaeon]|nr:hypothetical protein [Candidatus Thermoplasmatota archaeon]